jgi:hypothetical protein
VSTLADLSCVHATLVSPARVLSVQTTMNAALVHTIAMFMPHASIMLARSRVHATLVTLAVVFPALVIMSVRLELTTAIQMPTVLTHKAHFLVPATLVLLAMAYPCATISTNVLRLRCATVGGIILQMLSVQFWQHLHHRLEQYPTVSI